MALRLAFMGTPDFAVPSLDALVRSGHEIAAVYSQPPRPTGRGHRTQPSAVHRFAEAHGLDVRTPTSLKSPEAQADFADLHLDVAVVAAYGLILPRPILAAPRLGCVNVHASLLPRWRGAAPIQRAILAGDTETGVTIMQMEAGLDTGPMLLREAVPIGPATTGPTLTETLADLGARLILPALTGLAGGNLTPEPQPENGVTYASKITRDDGLVDWQDAVMVDRQVRALNPWPSVLFRFGDETLKIQAADHVADAQGEPGEVLDDRLTIACREGGGIRPTRLQRPGKAAMAADALLRGFAIPPGTRLA